MPAHTNSSTAATARACTLRSQTETLLIRLHRCGTKDAAPLTPTAWKKLVVQKQVCVFDCFPTVVQPKQHDTQGLSGDVASILACGCPRAHAHSRSLHHVDHTMMIHHLHHDDHTSFLHWQCKVAFRLMRHAHLTVTVTCCAQSMASCGLDANAM